MASGYTPCPFLHSLCSRHLLLHWLPHRPRLERDHQASNHVHLRLLSSNPIHNVLRRDPTRAALDMVAVRGGSFGARIVCDRLIYAGAIPGIAASPACLTQRSPWCVIERLHAFPFHARTIVVSSWKPGAHICSAFAARGVSCAIRLSPQHSETTRQPYKASPDRG